MSDKTKLLNCYQDLQRAAVALLRYPTGSTHKIFLNHAVSILRELGDSRIKMIQKVRVKLNSKLDKKRIADKILTAGLLPG